MKLRKIRDQVEEIRRMADDRRMDSDISGAHQSEDSLYRDFLIYLGKGFFHWRWRRKLKEVLKSEDIHFQYWYD